MSRYEDAIAAIGAGRRGIITERLVQGAAVPLHALDTLRSRGVLISLGRGVDRLRDHPFDFWSQCQAALDLAGPGAVLTVRSIRSMTKSETCARRPPDMSSAATDIATSSTSRTGSTANWS
jgi:hypothetical protein